MAARRSTATIARVDLKEQHQLREHTNLNHVLELGRRYGAGAGSNLVEEADSGDVLQQIGKSGPRGWALAVPVLELTYERHITDFINRDQLVAGPAPQGAAELQLMLGFDQFIDQRGLEALLRRGLTPSLLAIFRKNDSSPQR